MYLYIYTHIYIYMYIMDESMEYSADFEDLEESHRSHPSFSNASILASNTKIGTVCEYEGPWSELPTVPSYPHYPHKGDRGQNLALTVLCVPCLLLESGLRGPRGVAPLLPLHVSYSLGSG